MALLSLVFVLVQSLIQYPQPAGDGLDEATHRRMQERQELLDREMARLLQELEQQDEGWGAVLFGALQQWPFWVLAGVLLLLGLWFGCRRRSSEASSSSKDLSSCKTLGDEGGKDQEEDSVGSEEGGENTGVTVEEDDGGSGKDSEGSPVAANGEDDVPGDNTGEGTEEEPGNVAENDEDLDEENDGEKKDVQVEQDKNAGKEEGGDGNEEKTNGVNMKVGSNEDVNEGEDNADGQEEYMDVKVQESSDASEQRSRDCTGQEDSSERGNEAAHSGFAATEEEKKDVLEEDGNDRKQDEEQGDVNVEADKKEDGKEGEPGNVAASEKEDKDGGKEESGSGGIEDREDTRDVGNEQGNLLVDHIKWPVEDLERGCSVTAELMKSFSRVFVDSASNSFYPVPQEAIGVGSAFEGWSPRDWDGVYRVLVPLDPPPGHAFELELNSEGQMAARTFSVRVELVCTCRMEQLDEKFLCFLHYSRKELRRKQQRSLLETLCTGSYLDVEKTSHWFHHLVRCSWRHVPQSYSWHLVFQPSSRSCQFQLSKGKESLTVEMLFGVRQEDSDIFVVSQPTEAQKGGSLSFVSSQPAQANFIASTEWPETYAVAEAKFFQHIARQLPCESLHLKCLQLFTCILRGTGFSSSTWKTVVMHVLTTVPLSRWCRREFARRLWDIMAYLRRCLQLKRLDHFVLGNERLPAEISLPPAMRRVEPLNLFERLARDPAAHEEAMQAYGQLRFRLWVLLSNQ
ncbi:inositol 1,4,5-trisphosphate receptor-interacting protein-like 1 [Motacilla alba alba]|uniref:inositol 1,4,5-trisphosphate receptor-interacting protein-like 1 n=1 Tax=Motacilla alba alba TaxID=1094192 RepID=UPI0018D5A435|nr:inositol 1,4,5-trisphosphate receptor-interacting protein-like 1 [Motacilla alba alba]XP_038009670.1 inositol 1,4,5-trisphosphate receptor-interacting protein-like 1 [Motacilla alba alba]